MIRRNGRIAGVLFFIASTQFLLGLVAAEAMYPGYSIADNYVSDLGVGPSALVFNAAAFLFGLLTLSGAYFLPRTVELQGVTVLLALMAVGAMGVGIFTSAFPTIHGAVSLMAFGFGGLSAIASWKATETPLSVFGVVLGLMTLGALTLFASGMVTTGALTSRDPPTSAYFLGLGPGGIERMIIYPALLWLTLFSGYFLSGAAKQEASSAGAT